MAGDGLTTVRRSGLGVEMKSAVLASVALLVLSACGELVPTYEYVSSDIPGLALSVGQGVIRRGIVNCPADGGITTSVHRQSTELRLQNDTMAYECR